MHGLINKSSRHKFVVLKDQVVQVVVVEVSEPVHEFLARNLAVSAAVLVQQERNIKSGAVQQQLVAKELGVRQQFDAIVDVEILRARCA